MQRKTFSLGLMYLRAAYLKNTPEFTKEQLEVWWISLNDLNDEDFLQTCKEIIKIERWFPTIADIRKAPIKQLDKFIPISEQIKIEREQERKQKEETC